MRVGGVGCALANGVPLRMGSVSNDGRNALDMAADSVSVRASWIALMVAERQARGARLRDMPSK